MIHYFINNCFNCEKIDERNLFIEKYFYTILLIIYDKMALINLINENQIY